MNENLKKQLAMLLLQFALSAPNIYDSTELFGRRAEIKILFLKKIN